MMLSPNEKRHSDKMTVIEASSRFNKPRGSVGLIGNRERKRSKMNNLDIEIININRQI